MLLSKKWLSQFVKIPCTISDTDLACAITSSTVEVERVVDQAVAFENIVVGLVKSVDTHPNADRLKVCKVDVGNPPPARGSFDSELTIEEGARGGGSCVIQIVCGGANVRAGMKVAVALSGAKVRWHGEGELVELSDTKIRGVESKGMICASAEIGLPRAEKEGDNDILDLGEESGEPGTNLAKALGHDDVIFEIEHKSLTNRPDLLCHYGMAREIGVLYRVPLSKYTPSLLKSGKGINIKVEIDDKKLCQRYVAVAVEGVKVAPSPRWLQNRLNSCGVRAINNVVDVTNYVMLEMGQPMHAFDVDKIGGDKVNIQVRATKALEKVMCLDDETYILDAGVLLITDSKRPIAIAGLMGDKKSAVSVATTRVVFESANFSPVSVRKTSQKLALRSESSARFEKALDPELCGLAAARAVELLKELCPTSRVASNIADKRAGAAKPITISFSQKQVNDRLGTAIPAKETREILTRLGFEVKATKSGFKARVPTWRATKDVTILEDVVEEVARFYGYGNIPSTLPSFPIVPALQSRVRSLTRAARRVLAVAFDAIEVYQYAFVSPQTLTVLGEDQEKYLRLANPLADDRPLLARSLVPNLLESVRRNQRQVDTVALFECEKVFWGDVKGEDVGNESAALPSQPLMLSGVFSEKGCLEPFWKVKTMVENLFESFGMMVELKARKGTELWLHPERQADVIVEGMIVGLIAEVEQDRALSFGLDNRVGVFEINMDVVAALPTRGVSYKPVATHPAAERDLAFVVNSRVEFALIKRAVESVSELLREVRLFDVYRGEGVEEGKKSVAVHLVIRAQDRTLESSEVESVVLKIRGVLEKEFSATIRSL